MKITKRQLKRIIKEEKVKLIEQSNGHDHLVSDETGQHYQAMDRLDEDLRNAVALAIEAGLLLDDITDALALAEEFPEMTLRV